MKRIIKGKVTSARIRTELGAKITGHRDWVESSIIGEDGRSYFEVNVDEALPLETKVKITIESE